MLKQLKCLSVVEMKARFSSLTRLEDEEEFAQHIEECDECGSSLDVALSDDPLVSALVGETPLPAATEIADRLKHLGQLPIQSVSGCQTHVISGNSSVVDGMTEVSDDDFSFLAPAQGEGEMGRLGQYRVLSVLGSGGMGIVLRAEDTALQRPVALKVVRPRVASPAARERFLREARLAASLKNDHVVTIHQVSEEKGVPFLAMELLEGESLEARLKREGKLPTSEVLRIGRDIALGLAAAHKKGLIHRDVKPANVWLESSEDGNLARVKLLDFGLAREGSQPGLTQVGCIVGTPGYMAPEQARSEPVDGRSDLFSLGCLLYKAATGHAAFDSKDPSAS